MNEIEVAKFPNGLEGFLAELKPATQVIWNSATGTYEIDHSPQTQAHMKVKLDKFKNALRDIYEFGESVCRGTPKFCLALKNIFDGVFSIEDSSAKESSHYGSLNYKPSLGGWGQKEGFLKIVGQLGVSSSAAYRYKDLANFVDPQTSDFYPAFKRYSISLLSEIWTCANALYLRTLEKIKELCNLIPADTTVDEMRLYRKAREELNCYGGGLFKDYSFDKRSALARKNLTEVLKVYNELLQQAETKKLEATMSGVQTVAKEDKSKKVLPAADEITVKKEHYQKLSELAEKSMKIGLCAGCKHSGTNLNKCRCCRRYENLKDLFEAN